MQKSRPKPLSIIKTALQEDIGPGDITARLFVPNRRIKAQILVKQDGVICGLDVARRVFKTVDSGISFRGRARDGARIRRGRVIASLEGSSASILKGERVALNFLGHLSGIASRTDEYLRRVRPYRVKIMDTRKTTPGLRTLEKYAVRCGGGTNHRIGLWDQVLVKDNYLAVHGPQSIVHSLEKIIREKPKGMKVEIEVKNLKQFKQILAIGADIIMLDNFSIRNIKQAVSIRNRLLNTKYRILTTKPKLPVLEVSGGVNLSNVRRIAAAGVERISIGELTHSAPALDITLNCG